MNEKLMQLLRFCLVGLACLAFSVAALAGLHEFVGMNYLLAYVITFVLANILGYLLNARFTFTIQSPSNSGAVRYMLVNATLLGFNTVALDILVSRLHMWYIAAAILLAAFNAPASFVAQRFVTYRSAEQNRVHDA
jgi:putative flippase GtrA